MTAILRSKALIGIVLATTLMTLAACDPVIGRPSGPVRHATLTSGSGMSYRYFGNRTGVYIQPGTPASDRNVREVFWYADSAYRANQQNCVTWNTTATNGPQQPGIAMRIARVAGTSNGIKAITVTQNIWFAGVWIFNVHVWNSSNHARPYTQIASFDLSRIVGKMQYVNGHLQSTLEPPPWHICARTQSYRITFKVWTGTNPEPSWNDPTHVFTTRLPAGYHYPGYVGGYMGHLGARGTAVITGVTNGPLTP